MSIREKLLALRQRKTQLIHVDRLGPVVIQAPSEDERAKIETTLGGMEVKRLVVVTCVVDCDPAGREIGEVWLSDPQPKAFKPADIKLLGQSDSTAIDDISNAALALTRMSQEDQTTLLGESGKG